MAFSGKVVLVTGSSSGIGQEIAIQFAKAGASVIITGRDEEKIQNVVEISNKASPNKAKIIGVKCDVSIDKQLRELVDKVIDTFGGLNILVNNAGIATTCAFTDINLIDKYDTIMKTNLRAPFLLTNLLVPHLIKAKGNIINVSSIAGMRPIEQTIIYCTSKAGLDMFTKALAIELGPKGVRVNSVNPGAIKTPIFDTMGFSDDILAGLVKTCEEDYPLRRIGHVKDVAKFVLFLASDDASFVTGLVGQIDGGCLNSISTAIPK